MVRVVSRDETWIYLYDPETKLRSKQWLPTGLIESIEFKVEKSAMKVDCFLGCGTADYGGHPR